MIHRALEEKLRQWSHQYPVVTVIGPRQSGKTTLARHLFSKHAYVSLEDLDQRAFAKEDPRGMLARYREGAIFDEIQNAPELASYLQTEVDRDAAPGRFILTGSRQFELMERVTQSLAGRTAIGRLLPFSLDELYHRPEEIPCLEEVLFTGFYPRIHDKKLIPTEALSFYTSTYLERDVRQILRVGDLSTFERFLRLCAGRTGQILDTVRLGADVGVSHNTIRKWLSVLEARFLVKLLPPWFSNSSKRLVKSRKLYFVDVGLAAYLLGITEPLQLLVHPLRGALFETWVVSEALKARLHRGYSDNLFFYRDYQGREVDLILEYPDGCEAVEVKSGQTVGSDFFSNLHFIGKEVKVRKKCLVYGGEECFERSGVQVTSWRTCSKLFV